MSSGPAERREDDHRKVAIGPPRVLGEVREALGPPSELPLALLAGCLPGQDVDRLAPHLDSGVRLCLEVVVPGGVARPPPFEAKITHLDSSARYPTGFTRLAPDLAPVWCSSSSGVPSQMPPTRPSSPRNSSITCALYSAAVADMTLLSIRIQPDTSVSGGS